MRPAAIRTHQLTRRFGSVLAVDGLDLEVPDGSVYAFLGPNGAGKTTTIRALLGLIRPTSGGVELFGEALEPRRSTLLGRVGSLVETPSLYPHLTGHENLEVKRRLTRTDPSEIGRVLDIVGLGRDAKRLVRGYSLGMQQRLGLAKALMGRPQLLILDEPTNGLDPAGIVELRQLIRQLPEVHGMTVFVSSHLLGEVEQVATHVGIIGEGRLLFQGTPAELQGRTRGRITLSVDQPQLAKNALADNGWTVERTIDGNVTVEIETSQAAADVNAFLVRAGISVYQLRLERPSLEDLFLRLTANVELGRQVAA